VHSKNVHLLGEILKCTEIRKMLILYSLIFDFEEKIPMTKERVLWLTESKKVLRT